MADEEKKPRRRRQGPRFPPGFFASKRAIGRLSRFRDLLTHHRRSGIHLPTRPIEELIPVDTKPDRKHFVLEQMINKAAPVVWADLTRAGIATDIQWTDNSMTWDYEKKDTRPRNKRMTANLIGELSRVLDSDKNGEMFDMAIRILDQGIGAYDEMQKRAIRRKWNPLDGIAYLLSLPMRILDRAGYTDGEDAAPGLALVIFAWVVRVLVVAVLGLATWYFGINIPWGDVLGFLR